MTCCDTTRVVFLTKEREGPPGNKVLHHDRTTAVDSIFPPENWYSKLGIYEFMKRQSPHLMNLTEKKEFFNSDS